MGLLVDLDVPAPAITFPLFLKLTTTLFLLLCIANGVRLAFSILNLAHVGKRSLLRLQSRAFEHYTLSVCSLFPYVLTNELWLGWMIRAMG